MENTLLNGLKNATNYDYTTNGAVAYKHLKSELLELFGLGASYRGRSDDDCILLFKNAYEENPTYALKCLFYFRDITKGAGERRFFKVCLKWLAKENPGVVIRNLENIPEYGRWDDLFCLFDTPVEKNMLEVIKHQLETDVYSECPSLLAKWLPSNNTSSKKTRALSRRISDYLNFSNKQYRKTLSILRKRINVLEKLMSANKWDEIEFDKIPSVAGMRYREAFKRHDIERKQSEKEVISYEEFAKDTTKKVNAKALYPYECVEQVRINSCRYYKSMIDETTRAMLNKYWENIPDVLKDATFNGIVMCDTSGSMTWGSASATPIDVAISLSIYCAERAKGPFNGYYISFASYPQLIKVEGVDFCDKVLRIYKTNLIDNTNLEAAFDLLLDTALKNNCSQEDIPESVLVISDMQIDSAVGYGRHHSTKDMEVIKAKWARAGYKCPRLIYWNVNAVKNTFLDNDPNTTYVSGFSQNIFKQLMTGKTNYELMMEVLDSERYERIF